MPSLASETVVVTVHGTFSGVVDEHLVRWWQENSALSDELRAGFAADGFRVEPFIWKDKNTPGPNRESERRRAGRLLFDHLQEFEKGGATYHLIGHSHGGSVIWHALQHSALRRKRLNNLASWTTISTPFLSIGRDGSFWWHLSAAATVLLALTVISFWSFIGVVTHAPDLASLPLFDGIPDLRRTIGDGAFYALVGLLAAVAAVFLFALLIPLTDVWWFLVRRPRLALASRRATNWYMPHWLGIAHPQDEAIAGLKATLITAPDLVIRPRDSILAFIALRPFATIVNQFVWAVLIRKAQGCDLSKNMIRRVGDCPENFAQTVIVIPKDASDDLIALADRAAADVLTRFRGRLQTLSNQSDIAALSGVLAGTYDDDSLIHTSMFESPWLRRAIVEHVAGSDRKPLEARASHPSERQANPPVALSLAKAVLAIVIVVTVTILAAAVNLVFFQQSKLAAANRIAERLSEPSFAVAADAPIVGAALVRATDMGLSYAQAFAAADRISNGPPDKPNQTKAAAYQQLIRNILLKADDKALLEILQSPDSSVLLKQPQQDQSWANGLMNAGSNLAGLASGVVARSSQFLRTGRWRLPAERGPSQAHSTIDHLLLGHVVTLEAYVQSGRPVTPALQLLLQVTKTRVPMAIRSEKDRAEVYARLMPVALAFSQPALAEELAADLFAVDRNCGQWNVVVTNLGRRATTARDIETIEKVIRACNPPNATDRQRILRRLAVSARTGVSGSGNVSETCLLAKPLVSQASFNRAGPDEPAPPGYVECLALDGYPDRALRMASEARKLLARDQPARAIWDMARVLRSTAGPDADAPLAAEAAEWTKLALLKAALPGPGDQETKTLQRFDHDALELEILGVTEPARKTAFLAELTEAGRAIENSRQFGAMWARLREIYATYREKSLKGPCEVSAREVADIRAMVAISPYWTEKNPSEVVLAVVDLARRCTIRIDEPLFNSLLSVVSADVDPVRRARNIAQVAPLATTLQKGMLAAENAGLPDAVFQGYVAVADRHRPQPDTTARIPFAPVVYHRLGG